MNLFKVYIRLFLSSKKAEGGAFGILTSMIPKLLAVLIIVGLMVTFSAKAMQPIDPAYNSEKIKECNERWLASLGNERTGSDDVDEDGIIDYCDVCVVSPSVISSMAQSRENRDYNSKNFLAGGPNDKDRDNLVDGCDSDLTKKVDTLKYLGSFDRALEAECKKVYAKIKGGKATSDLIIDKGEGITKCQILS